jgi:hypothetical protein
MSSALVKGLALAVLLLAAGLALQTHRLNVAQASAARAEIPPAREAAKAAAAVVETVTVQLAARIDTVRLHLRDTVRVPAPYLAPRTAADTAGAVAALPGVVQRYEGCRADLQALVSECTRYRAAAERRFAADSTLIAKQDVALRTPAPRSRWSLGLTLGYGATATQDSTGAVRVRSGPSATIGASYRIAF